MLSRRVESASQVLYSSTIFHGFKAPVRVFFSSGSDLRVVCSVAEVVTTSVVGAGATDITTRLTRSEGSIAGGGGESGATLSLCLFGDGFAAAGYGLTAKVVHDVRWYV